MQSNSHGLGLGSYSVPNSHLPPIKPGGVAGSALTSSAPHSSPDLECGGGVGESPVTGYTDKSPNTWKYQSFQVLWMLANINLDRTLRVWKSELLNKVPQSLQSLKDKNLTLLFSIKYVSTCSLLLKFDNLIQI